MKRGVKILHFADAHIDIANFGKHDAESGLPVRIIDFLKSLDEIIDTAIEEKVDLVLFAGDAYKDRNPAPTFQREWGRRIMRLSRAGIPTVLLVGNHDLSPAMNRAHALEAFDTLEVPNVCVVDRPVLLRPADLNGLPLQVMALPWISRSGLMATLETETEQGVTFSGLNDVYDTVVDRLIELVGRWFEQIDPAFPVVLTAHCSVQGAVYGGERTVMLGSDVVFPASLVRDPRLDYVALGHIHKSQNLNEANYPPVIYPGSIERVDWGEAADHKFFVIAEVSRGNTSFRWCELKHIRPFIDRHVQLKKEENVAEQLSLALPRREELEGAMFRLVLEYPRELETVIDDVSLYEYTSGCLSFNLVKRPEIASRVRIPTDHPVGSLTPQELLKIYWRANHVSNEDMETLGELANQVITETHSVAEKQIQNGNMK
jgi:exonuclease SbcD